MQKNKFETFIVIISNLFPLYGLFFLGWGPFSTSFVFIVETIIILIFFELKIIAEAFNGIFENILPGIILIIPIVIFSAAQLALSTVMFATPRNQLYWNEIGSIVNIALISIAYGIILIFLRNLIDFFYYLKNKGYTKDQSQQIENEVGYIGKRIAMMQFTVIFGGGIGKIFSNPTLGVSVLILIQIYLNLKHYFSITLTQNKTM